MALYGPAATAITKVTPRRAGLRIPRKLDYLKCDQCRKAKVKCITQESSDKDKDCIRCLDKKLACSGRRTKAAALSQVALAGQSIAPVLEQHEASDTTMEHIMLVLLSLHHIFHLASQELFFIGEEQLLSIRGDNSWKFYHDILMEFCSGFSELTVALGKLTRGTGNVPQSVSSAILDINCGTLGEEDIVDRYSQKHHAGVAFILQMQNLDSKSSEAKVKNMLKSREAFMSDVAEMLELGSLDNELILGDGILELYFTGTQLFIPRHLFANEMVVQAIQRDGRRDILHRSVNHMLHDSNVVLDHAFVPQADDEDFLGRTSLHIACSMSMQERRSREIDLGTVAWPGVAMLGLDALDIAAMRGHVDIFRTASSSDFKVFDYQRWPPPGRRTYIHWAACNGYVDLVRFLVRVAEDSKISLTKVLLVADVDDQTTLSLAARRGHCDVVELLLHFTEELSLPEDYFTDAFIEAVQGRHLDVMKLLEPSTDLDSVQHSSDMTALTYAAKQGFLDGIKFLLEKGVNLNHVTREWAVWKTPLDFAAKGGHFSCVEWLKAHGALCRWEL